MREQTDWLDTGATYTLCGGDVVLAASVFEVNLPEPVSILVQETSNTAQVPAFFTTIFTQFYDGIPGYEPAQFRLVGQTTGREFVVNPAGELTNLVRDDVLQTNKQVHAFDEGQDLPEDTYNISLKVL